jgi:hypothetical protein
MRCRRLRLVANHTVYTVAPGFVMPYMTGYTDEVSKALFLIRFHVPCWAIAQVFGRDAMYWYRLEQSLGRFSWVASHARRLESPVFQHNGHLVLSACVFEGA